MIKLIKKHLFIGITWGCIAVVGNIIIFDLMNFDFLPNILDNFSAFALGVIIICIGFITVGGVVYEMKQLRFRLKLIIHIITGVGTLLIVGFSLNMLTLNNLQSIVMNVIINLLIVLAVWTFYYLRDKRELEEINAKIKEKKSQRQLDPE